jgi:hypothetical protein
VITRIGFINRKTALIKRSFSSKVSGITASQEVLYCTWFFPLAPLRVQSSDLTIAKATVTFAEIQTTDPSTENTNSRTQVACP